MSRRPGNPARRLADGGSLPFAGSMHSKSRSSPLLSIGLVVVGAILLIGYCYSGSGGHISNREALSKTEGGVSCTLEVQRAIPILKKAYGDSMRKVLHVGPDTCSAVSSLLKEEDTEAWGVEPYDLDDVSANCKSLVRKGLVRVADIKFPLPYRPKSFSLVIVSDALDYLSPKYLNKTLPELARVAADGLVVFSGAPGQQRVKVTELSKFGRPAKFRTSTWWISAGFVGDSLNRNMFVSLFCSLKRVSSDVKKWRPAGADRGFTFLLYNLTIAYHRTNLLARYGRWSANANGGELESLGYKEGYRVDVDIPEGTWADAPSFHDVLIFNTGHWWWAPSKFDPVKSPMLFFEKNQPLIPPVLPAVGLDKVLKHMILFVERRMRPGGIKLFRTQSPRHFEGGDWDQGGSCPRLQPLSTEKVEELFSLKNNGTNVESRLVNQHLFKALKGSSFHVLDITHLSEFRADAHPATAGGKKHDDCMHWCLPGITDIWNDLFIMNLNSIKARN
ncbi:hypothetical protein NC652_023456 [Populus alba x Populus x berolinensis]|nr:hypothetical protein NC652_023456 [Populus alba x Populus x berolinensis]